MLFSKQITLSKGASESTLTSTKLKAGIGVIYRAWISFPPGCAGLVKLRILHDGHPILPIHKDAYIRGDDFVFEVPLFYELLDEPLSIDIEGWNEDEVYDHTVDVMLLILRKELVLPLGSYEGIIAALASIMRR